MSVLMVVLLRPNKPPHWAMLAVMVSLAFVLSIVWLNIIANEVVGVLTALGLLLNIKTGPLFLRSKCVHCTYDSQYTPRAALRFYLTLLLTNSILTTQCSMLFSMCTGILGLTVLALGNCVADWVADTVVAKSGNTQMAFASCFGSPMLSHVLGLSVAFAVSQKMNVVLIGIG